MSLLPDLSLDSRALRVIKRPLPVCVRFALVDGVCQTLEGSVAYRSGDAILTGVEGENWPVERAKFDERYVPAGGTCTGADGDYVKKPLVVFAVQLDGVMELSMPAGGVLRGKAGDWLLQYGISDYGIAKNEIFRATYDFQQVDVAAKSHRVEAG